MTENPSAFERIGVVGAGMMGSEIALVFALSGHPTMLSDRDAPPNGPSSVCMACWTAVSADTSGLPRRSEARAEI